MGFELCSTLSPFIATEPSAIPRCQLCGAFPAATRSPIKVGQALDRFSSSEEQLASRLLDAAIVFSQPGSLRGFLAYQSYLPAMTSIVAECNKKVAFCRSSCDWTHEG